MAFTFPHYGTIAEANEYFDNRLHETAWSESNNADRNKALIAATRTIDALNYKGNKNPIFLALETDANATEETLRDAGLTQALKFPRGVDTVVPDVIKFACFEIAYSLLDGKDPEIELENLMVTRQKYASVNIEYNRKNVPVEHIVNMIPSSIAWRWLRPFLVDEDQIILRRVS